VFWIAIISVSINYEVLVIFVTQHCYVCQWSLILPGTAKYYGLFRSHRFYWLPCHSNDRVGKFFGNSYNAVIRISVTAFPSSNILHVFSQELICNVLIEHYRVYIMLQILVIIASGMSVCDGMGESMVVCCSRWKTDLTMRKKSIIN
jgi:hypothetical protein